jgi:hypothetical protein
MAFPYSYKFTYKHDKTLSIKGDDVIKVIDRFLPAKKNESGELVFESGLFGMQYSVTIANTKDVAVTFIIKSKSVVNTILILLLLGAFIPKIGVEGFFIYALVVFVLIYFLFFSIFSSELSTKIEKVLSNFEIDEIKDCDRGDCCPACGYKLGENDLFCPNCGLRVKQNLFTKDLNISKYQDKSPKVKFHYKKKDEKNRR